MKAGHNKKAYLALVIVSFFWGTTYLVSRYATKFLPGIYIAGIRQLASGSILLLYFKARGFAWPERQSWKPILIQSTLLLAINNGAQTWAVQYIASGLTAIIAALMPLLVTVLSIIFIRTVIFNRTILLGLIGSFLGILLIFQDYLPFIFLDKFRFGVALAFFGTICFASGTVYASINKPLVSVFYSASLQMCVAGILLLLFSIATGSFVSPSHIDVKAYYCLLYLIVIGSLLCYSAFMYAVQHLPATQVSVFAYVNPIVAIILGFCILKEPLTLKIILGSLLTVGGVYLVNQEMSRQRKLG